jgi:hypothetical protein
MSWLSKKPPGRAVKRARKSPLRAPPLRLAGKSVDAELDDHVLNELLTPYLVAALVVILAGFEWFRYFSGTPPTPWLFTALAVLVTIYAALRIRRGLKRGREIKLGRTGERFIGQYLEHFRRIGFHVFHDVPSSDANIDHVLIGRQGLFTIETKTISKPVRGDARIRVAGGKIFANGVEIMRNPIVQAKAQAGWLANFVAEVGFSCRVQPVVVFPGWFVERCNMKALGVWVLEHKELGAFLRREPHVLTPEVVGALASALTSHIRAQSKA